jgi:hypothetical protein
MTRRSCALGCGLWVLVMTVPALAFLLAAQRELNWSRGPGGLVQDRVFYIDEPQAGGLGYLSSRVVRDETAAGGPLCLKTRVVYLLWRDVEGGDQNVDYCQCYTRDTEMFQLTAATCPGE